MQNAARGLSIGRLSRDAGCNIETIRYYEKVGLLPAPPRTAGGHRLYTEDHVRRVGFIRRGRELGFSLDEVRVLLDLGDRSEYQCAKVKAITLDHLRSVKRKIKDLKRLERTLTALSNECPGESGPYCPIIDALYSGRR